MAYNNGFPIGYAQPYPPISPYTPQPQMQMQPQKQTGPIWVQGEGGVKSFLLAPGETVALWDSEAQVIYLKSADASGMPSMKVLDYTIRDNPSIPSKAPVGEGPEYATKNEIQSTKDDIKHEIDVIKKENDDLKKQIDVIKESLGIE